MKKLLIVTGAIGILILCVFIFTHFGKYHYQAINTNRSSFITKAEYNQYFEHLILGLNGKRYDYCGVPTNIWNGFKNADSLGNFYNYSIKNKYSCGVEKVGSDSVCLSSMIAVSNTWTSEITYAKNHTDDILETRQTNFYNECIAHRL
jgi:hypothetical protein